MSSLFLSEFSNEFHTVVEEVKKLLNGLKTILVSFLPESLEMR